MVGRGVLRECLLDADVEKVLLIGRRATGQKNPKIQEIVRADLGDLSASDAELTGYDACFFCLGVSSVGMPEADYRRVTYDLTIGVAGRLAKLNPSMTFIYVSGQGTDSSENGRTNWARVKGATENALLRMPFRAAYMFRPGFIEPMHGEEPKAETAKLFLRLLGPLLRLAIRFAPQYGTTTERMGRAMLFAVKHGAPKKVLENDDINALGRV